MKRKLTRVEPLSLGKVLGLLYAAGALLFSPIFLGIMAISALASNSGDGPPLPIALGIGAGLMLLAPIFYGVIGFICGALGGLFYNLVSKWIGGVEFEVE